MTITPVLDTVSTRSVSHMRDLIQPHLLRTPLLRSKRTGPADTYLKCENLQITDSFKVRGAFSALLGYRGFQPEVWERIVRDGVVTCSSGNFAQGLAHVTAELGIPYSVVVPESITAAKRSQIIRYNPDARITEVPYPVWQRTMVTSDFPQLPGFFLSSETDPYVSLGLATVGLEVLEDLPTVDAVLVPYGGGNLAYSIASLLREAGSQASVYAVEISTGAPLTASLRAGRPVGVPYTPSFVDGIGAGFVIPAQFERIQDRLAGTFTVTPQEVAAALSSLAFTDKIISEGAGAAAYAAVLKHEAAHGWKRPCAIVSGAVIDPDVLLQTMTGTRSAVGA
ncbi:pyridoxal-phosphate dependent enzyme [Streptomyces sp. NPDC006551]|uniref:pyridoxal-phosphate dependent enzyme n=1 Tax=Streptomyces sp. NPDC006551 TaxID=3157178 RepID=UPI0033BA06F0